MSSANMMLACVLWPDECGPGAWKKLEEDEAKKHNVSSSTNKPEKSKELTGEQKAEKK